MKTAHRIVGGVIIAITLAFIIVVALYMRPKEHFTVQTSLSKSMPNNTIDAYDYSVNSFFEKQPISSNLTDHDILYPLKGSFVDYGSQYPDDCPCLYSLTPP